MYDYATSTYQVRILNELQSLNSNIVQIGINLNYLLISLCIILLVYFSYKIFVKCLGK